jgi:oxygen-independent coproporphyrinogen-3 oxidase
VHYVASRLPEASDLGDAFVASCLAYLEEFVEDGLLSEVPSIYVGGGTPTVLGRRLPELVAGVRGILGSAADTEVTIEANPESVTRDLVRDLRSAGVTRVSLGVQSFDDDALRLLGRAHDGSAAREAISVLNDGCIPFSVDLMCGVPGRDSSVWSDDLATVLSSKAGHVSVYPLSVEEGTPLAERIAAGSLVVPDADDAASELILASRILHSAGFARYEVANYAQPGQECVHNLRYWTGGPYLGVGPSAASMLPVESAKRTPLGARAVYSWPDDWRVRFTWHTELEPFLASLWDCQPAAIEALTPAESAREDAMLALRLQRGLAVDAASKAHVSDVLQELESEGLVYREDDRWRTTERGWLLGNEVFARVWNTEA